MDEQKVGNFSSSGSDASLKSDSLLGSTITVLDVNEPLINIISKEQGDTMQQSNNDGNVLKCDNHSQIEVLFRYMQLKCLELK